MDYLQSIGGGVRQYGGAQLAGSNMGFSSKSTAPGGSSGLGKSAVALKITGALMNAYSGYGSMRKQEYASRHNRAIVASEKTISQAAFEFEMRRLKRSGERVISSQLVSIGKNGLEYSGSSLDVMEDTVKELELDMFALRHQNAVSDLQYDMTEKQLTIEEKYAKRMKIPAAITGFMGSFV